MTGGGTLPRRTDGRKRGGGGGPRGRGGRGRGGGGYKGGQELSLAVIDLSAAIQDTEKRRGKS